MPILVRLFTITIQSVKIIHKTLENLSLVIIFLKALTQLVMVTVIQTTYPDYSFFHCDQIIVYHINERTVERETARARVVPERLVLGGFAPCDLIKG